MGDLRRYPSDKQIPLDELKKYINLFDYANVYGIGIQYSRKTKSVIAEAHDKRGQTIGTESYPTNDLCDARNIVELYENAFDYPHPAEVNSSVEIDFYDEPIRYKRYRKHGRK